MQSSILNSIFSTLTSLCGDDVFLPKEQNQISMSFVIDINMPLVLERKGSSFMWKLAYLSEAFIHFGGVNHSKIATMTNL